MAQQGIIGRSVPPVRIRTAEAYARFRVQERKACEYRLKGIPCEHAVCPLDKNESACAIVWNAIRDLDFEVER